jgi:hypothetical protein
MDYRAPRLPQSVLPVPSSCTTLTSSSNAQLLGYNSICFLPHNEYAAGGAVTGGRIRPWSGPPPSIGDIDVVCNHGQAITSPGCR